LLAAETVHEVVPSAFGYEIEAESTTDTSAPKAGAAAKIAFKSFILNSIPKLV
jgi:hypothetical protein